jgi:SAM-dependent methyltransferase
MSGDLTSNVLNFRNLLESHQITSSTNELAVDLGAGHGIQTIALAECGFNVTAIDFNDQLLTELASNTNGKNVTIINDDMRNVRQHATDASIIVCCGDTITHLGSYGEITKIATDIFHSLKAGGKAIFSFRDYSIPLEGTNRFIPVKSDENRILTCILDYSDDFVTVTDLLHERVNSSWQQKVSAYRKVRLRAPHFIEHLKSIGFKILNSDVVNRLTTVVAQRDK